MQQHQQYDAARPGLAPVQTSSPRASKGLAKGWLTTLKHWIVGEQDPVQARLHQLERQGKGLVRVMHTASYVMLVLFSIGSAVGICGTLVQEVMANGPLTWRSLIPDVVIGVSLMLVLCMDLGDIYAAFMIRLHAQRRSPWTAYIIHGIVIVVATILEGGTFIYMSFTYDSVVAGIAAALVIGRGILAPLFAVYLNMAKPVPPGVADVAYETFIGSATGVARKIIHISNDPDASVADGAELMRASAYVNKRDEAVLDNIVAATQRVGDRNASNAISAPRAIVRASRTLPLTETLEHHVASAAAYKALHDPDMAEPADPWASDRGYDDEVGDEAEALFGTLDLREDDLASAIDAASDTSSPKRRTRTPNNSGPRRDNLARSKSMREFNRKLKSDAKAQRRAAIRDAVYAILDEWHADGRVEAISDKELARRVAARVNFDVNPSGNTVARWRGPWQSSRAHKAALELPLPDEIEPMEPQELRELQEVW